MNTIENAKDFLVEKNSHNNEDKLNIKETDNIINPKEEFKANENEKETSYIQELEEENKEQSKSNVIKYVNDILLSQSDKKTTYIDN